jgi:hypothetical protein
MIVQVRNPGRISNSRRVFTGYLVNSFWKKPVIFIKDTTIIPGRTAE